MKKKAKTKTKQNKSKKPKIKYANIKNILYKHNQKKNINNTLIEK